MRIPLRKLYRAYPELDRFSDAPCKLLVRRVRLNATSRALLRGLPLIAFAFSLVIIIVVLATTDLRAAAGRLAADADLWLSHLAVLGIPPFAGLLVRDQLLRYFLIKAIRLRIDRVRCRQCRYILIGQRPSGNQVTCPECGRPNRLNELGVTAEDLIPPASEVEYLSMEARALRKGA